MTVVLHRGGQRWDTREIRPVLGVYLGLAFRGEREVFASEGESGRVRLLSLPRGRTVEMYDLNQGGTRGSYTGDLAYDPERQLLFVLDQGNSRLVVVQARERRVAGSIETGKLPFALALAPDRRRLYVAHAVGEEALAVVDVENAAAPRLVGRVRIGEGANGVTATATQVYVSKGRSDSIAVVDAGSLAVTREIPIRIPGLEALRGVLPIGMAVHEPTGWLLVAEAGINAVGVIDPRAGEVLGHLPAGWFPTRVALDGDIVIVANAKGSGAGPNARRQAPVGAGFRAEPGRGSISRFTLPERAELAGYTERVYEANGFRPSEAAAALPAGVKYVVLIVKEHKTFDEIFGNVEEAANGKVRAAPELARFGRYGWITADPRTLRTRVQLPKKINVTPNHQAIAERWAISDNFYADAERGELGRLWLAGSYPDAWTESGARRLAGDDPPAEGAVWEHLRRSGISFGNFGGTDPTRPDQQRASEFIAAIEEYVRAGREISRFLRIDLPGDRVERPRPGDGYPFEASSVAGNDYAIGRIIEFLSETKWWGEMAVFVTQSGTQGGADHVDSHRTVLAVGGPWAKKNYVSRTNSSFPGLWKTILRLLGSGPLNLFDAAAADLSDCFGTEPDPAPYKAEQVLGEVFDPAKTRPK